MRIGIIGFGFVGQAIGWAHKDQDLIIRDPKLQHSAELSKFNSCDAVFVCVPTPSLEDGHCDTSTLEQTIKELLFVLINNPIPVICKSTAPPSFYEKLWEQYPNIVYCPEFLTAANNVSDYTDASYFVLGGHKEWCEKARHVIRQGMSKDFPYDRFIFTDIKSASLYKYFMNAYLATKVTFMNEFYSLAETIGVDWNDLKRLTAFEHRIGSTHMDVPGPDGEFGWGGMCFPKDIAAIQEEAMDHQVYMDLLGHVEDINKKHRKLK